jgi:hypothetical protein
MPLAVAIGLNVTFQYRKIAAAAMRLTAIPSSIVDIQTTGEAS